MTWGHLASVREHGFLSILTYVNWLASQRTLVKINNQKQNPLERTTPIFWPGQNINTESLQNSQFLFNASINLHMTMKNLSPLLAFRSFLQTIPPFICCNLSPLCLCICLRGLLVPPHSHTMIGNQVTDWLAAEGELRLAGGRRELCCCSDINRAGKVS